MLSGHLRWYRAQLTFARTVERNKYSSISRNAVNMKERKSGS